MKDGKNNNREAKKILKIIEDMEGGKIDHSKLVYRSGDNEYFDFNRFGPLSSFYLKLVNGSIGIGVVKLNTKEFRNEIDKLERKKAKKQSYKTNKKDVLENAEAFYDGLKMIVDPFERQVFEYRGRPQTDVNYDLETYGLTDKELQMFKKLFKSDNPDELWNVLMDGDRREYDEL